MIKLHSIRRSPLLASTSLDEIWTRTKRSLGRIAHEQRQWSVSPRPDKPFDVGCGLALFTPKHELLCVGASNFKAAVGPRQHLCPDCCAEMYGIAIARKMGCKIIGMVVEAPPQPDDFSGFDVGVTVSCVFCRYEFRQELKNPESPLRPNTWLRFNHPTKRKKFFEKRVSAFLALFPNDPKKLDPKHLANRGGP